MSTMLLAMDIPSPVREFFAGDIQDVFNERLFAVPLDKLVLTANIWLPLSTSASQDTLSPILFRGQKGHGASSPIMYL